MKEIKINLRFTQQGHFRPGEHLQHRVWPVHSLDALRGGCNADPFGAGQRLGHLGPSHLADWRVGRLELAAIAHT